MVRGRPRKIENLFNPSSKIKRLSKTSQGQAGFDNPRENIDPHIITQVLNTKELLVSGAKIVNDWDRQANGLQPAVTTDKISGADLFISGKVGVGTSNPGSTLTLAGGNGLYIYDTDVDRFLRLSQAGNISYIDARSDTNLGEIQFRTKAGSVNAIRIDEAGKVGMGTTSPDVNLHIVKGDGTVPTLSAIDDIVILQNNAAAGDFATLTILSGTTGKSVVNFADDDDKNAGDILYDHTDNYMSFRTNGVADRVRIVSGGNIGINKTTPDTTLDVEGTISGAHLDIANRISSASLINSGQATIGSTTDTPADTQVLIETTRDKMLHLKSSSGGTQLKLETTGGGDPQILFDQGTNSWTIRYDQSETDLEIQYNGIDKLEINPAGSLGLKNITATPDNESGVGKIFISGGNLYYQGTSGTLTQVAVA